MRRTDIRNGWCRRSDEVCYRSAFARGHGRLTEIDLGRYLAPDAGKVDLDGFEGFSADGVRLRVDGDDQLVFSFESENLECAGPGIHEPRMRNFLSRVNAELEAAINTLGRG